MEDVNTETDLDLEINYQSEASIVDKRNRVEELRSKMEDANTENDLDLEINYVSEASIGEKRKREGKLRSKVWHHFSKIIKADGTSDKCQCNYCRKHFTCSSRSGTTHLLRHITDGICPAFRTENNDMTVTVSSYSRGGNIDYRNNLLPWKFDQGLGRDVEVELLHEPQAFQTLHDEYLAHAPLPSRSRKHPQKSVSKSQPKGQAWVNEFKNCVAKLVELTNGKIPIGSLQTNTPDYSVCAALKCLNELEDIDQSSEIYLDAFEILQDAGQRECFICLPTEPRRRWLQRVLHRRYPLRYSSNM